MDIDLAWEKLQETLKDAGYELTFIGGGTDDVEWTVTGNGLPAPEDDDDTAFSIRIRS